MALLQLSSCPRLEPALPRPVLPTTGQDCPGSGQGVSPLVTSYRTLWRSPELRLEGAEVQGQV